MTDKEMPDEVWLPPIAKETYSVGRVSEQDTPYTRTDLVGELKAENERLKEKVESAIEHRNRGAVYEKEHYDAAQKYFKQTQQQAAEIERLRKALEEIKEITGYAGL